MLAAWNLLKHAKTIGDSEKLTMNSPWTHHELTVCCCRNHHLWPTKNVPSQVPSASRPSWRGWRPGSSLPRWRRRPRSGATQLAGWFHGWKWGFSWGFRWGFSAKTQLKLSFQNDFCEIGDLSWGFTMKTFFRLIRWLMGDFMGISRDVLTTYTWWLVPISICVLDVSRLMIRIPMMSQYITGHSLTISDVDMCKDLHQLGRPIINSHWIRLSHHFIASNSPIIDVKVYKTLVYHQLEVLFVGLPSQIQNKNCGFRYPLALSAKIPIS